MLEVFQGKTADEITAIIARLSPQSRAVLASEINKAKENQPVIAPKAKNLKQVLATNIQADEVWYGGGSFGGKGLSLDTPLPTPQGWTTMGAVKVGDALFDELGKVCYVAHVSEISNRKCYRVKFSDGSEIVADDVHRWVTFTVSELSALTRRSDEFRAKRRENRPSRAKGNKSKAFVDSINARNAQIAEALIKDAPIGTMRDTAEIAATLTDRGRNNHAIRVCRALDLPDIELPIPPYTLGAWLGDGTACNGGITGIDPEIFERIRQDGFVVTNHKHPNSHCIVGLLVKLRAAGILNNKHIPAIYLRSSYRQRLELLQGLMDTDGHASLDGGCEFDGINERLIDGAKELILSLGIKANKQRGTAKLNGRVICPKFRIQFTTNQPIFCLKRKLDRLKPIQNRRSFFRSIVSCDEVESVPTKCIGVTSPTHQFLAGRSMIPTHNTYWAAIMALTKHHRTTIFRRSYQATGELRKIFRTILANKFESASRYVLGGSPTVIRPPTGKNKITAVEITLASLQRPDDIEKFQGNTSDCYVFDEAVQFTEGEIRMVQAWLRPSADTPEGMRCQMLCTFNPPLDAAGLWVLAYLAPWIDVSHPLYPVPFGQVMHRITFEGKDYWFSEQTTMTHHPQTDTPLDEPLRSMSVVFIQALPTDNPDLDEKTRQKILQHPESRKLFFGDMSASLQDNPFAVVKLAAYRSGTLRAATRERPSRPPDGLSLDPALVGDDFAIVPFWIDEAYFGAPIIVPGIKIGGKVENVLHWLLHYYPKALTDHQLVIDGGGTVGGALGQLVKQAIANINGDISRVFMFDGSKGTTWKEYQDPNLPSANLFKPRPFQNTISAAWITLGQRLNYVDCIICIEAHNQYETQLCVREIKTNDVQTIRMESKEDFKKRLGRSPDAADALCMAYWWVFYVRPHQGYSAWQPQTV